MREWDMFPGDPLLRKNNSGIPPDPIDQVVHPSIRLISGTIILVMYTPIIIPHINHTGVV